jgi:glycine cleavage system transcriptional repressor
MRQALVAIFGQDRPGIVHQVSRVLANLGCHILSVSQTTLLGQFAGLFATKAPEEVSYENISEALAENLAGSALSHFVARQSELVETNAARSEPYVLTILGPDHPEVIPEVTKTVASFEANIENLRSVKIENVSNGWGDKTPIALVLEITVPVTVQQNAFRQALELTAEERGIEISLQHRDIFEAIHRV